jgi:hypothetical protein
MLIFDIWIDFVNLRSEKYAENSRIPTVVCTISSIPLNTHFNDLCKEYILPPSIYWFFFLSKRSLLHAHLLI